MFDIKNTVYDLCEMFDGLQTAEDLRNTANYQAMLKLQDILESHGVPFDDSSRIIARLPLDLSPRFHLDHPKQFHRLIETFGRALALVYKTAKEDFDQLEVVLDMVTNMTRKRTYQCGC